jgi:hypothetical protein
MFFTQLWRYCRFDSSSFACLHLVLSAATGGNSRDDFRSLEWIEVLSFFVKISVISHLVSDVEWWISHCLWSHDACRWDLQMSRWGYGFEHLGYGEQGNVLVRIIILCTCFLLFVEEDFSLTFVGINFCTYLYMVHWTWLCNDNAPDI